jgi:hypothetical protein
VNSQFHVPWVQRCLSKEVYLANFRVADEWSGLYSCPIVNHIMSSTWQGKQKITAIVHLNNTVHLASDTWDLNLCRIVSKVVSGYVLISQLSEQLLTDVLHSSFLKFSWAGRGIHGVCSFLNALLFDGYLSTCAGQICSSPCVSNLCPSLVPSHALAARTCSSPMGNDISNSQQIFLWNLVRWLGPFRVGCAKKRTWVPEAEAAGKGWAWTFVLLPELERLCSDGLHVCWCFRLLLETAPLFKSVVLELWVLQEFFTKLLAAVKFLRKDIDMNVRLLGSGKSQAKRVALLSRSYWPYWPFWYVPCSEQWSEEMRFDQRLRGWYSN